MFARTLDARKDDTSERSVDTKPLQAKEKP